MTVVSKIQSAGQLPSEPVKNASQLSPTDAKISRDTRMLISLGNAGFISADQKSLALAAGISPKKLSSIEENQGKLLGGGFFDAIAKAVGSAAKDTAEACKKPAEAAVKAVGSAAKDTAEACKKPADAALKYSQTQPIATELTVASTSIKLEEAEAAVKTAGGAAKESNSLEHKTELQELKKKLEKAIEEFQTVRTREESLHNDLLVRFEEKNIAGFLFGCFDSKSEKIDEEEKGASTPDCTIS